MGSRSPRPRVGQLRERLHLPLAADRRVIGIAAFAIGRAGGSVAEAGAEPTPGAEPGAEEDNPSLLRTELPFGPFLAMAAAFYLFAEPWIQLHFHLPGG